MTVKSSPLPYIQDDLTPTIKVGDTVYDKLTEKWSTVRDIVLGQYGDVGVLLEDESYSSGWRHGAEISLFEELEE